MSRIHFRPLLGVSIGLAACLLSGGTIHAQESDPGGPPAPEASAFSTSELENFASARDEVLEVRSEYQEKAMSAEPDEIGAIQQEMVQKQMEAVEKSGLDVERYNEIANAVQSNPSLAARVDDMR